MNNQKDTKKTELNSYRQNNFVDNNTLINKPIYEFANKKTEKLVTALYMVTDCMSTDDALKGKLRLLGVHLLSDIYSSSLPHRQGLWGKDDNIIVSLNSIYEILSLIEIANTMGYISDMNTTILKKEFDFLTEELKSHLSKEKHSPFTLDEKMFDLPLEISRTNKMSFINKRTNNNVLYKTKPSISHKKVKAERVEKIISIIKDMGDSSIKDIFYKFTDCSEKTIQRELNDLIENGQIKKVGAKRWSRYQIIENIL